MVAALPRHTLLPLIVALGLCAGCTKNVGELKIKVLHSPADDPLEDAKTIRIRIVGPNGEIARRAFDAQEKNEGQLRGVPTGSGLQVIH